MSIARVALARRRTRSFDRNVYSAYELGYIASKGKGASQTAAGIFAAKEAFLKAVGSGIFSLKLRDIEIGHAEGGRPVVSLSESLAEIGELYSQCSLSITHSGDTATAVVFMLLK